MANGEVTVTYRTLYKAVTCAAWPLNRIIVVVYYCRTYVKAVRGGGSEERGRVLWDATSRGLCGPPRTNVRVAWANFETTGTWARITIKLDSLI